MYSPDSSDIDLSVSGSHLLSESPVLGSLSGSGRDDLSISELSLPDRLRPPAPFSLLARQGKETPTPTLPVEHDSEGDDSAEDVEDAEKVKRSAAQSRDKKLQSDIFILKKLNASFAQFNEALEDTGSANERVATQLTQTDALLNKYIRILSKSEEFSRLILNEKWQGAEADELTIEQERIEAEERVRREEIERLESIRREKEQKEAEERERINRAEKERAEKERQDRAAAKGVRGVRSTRASVRGTTQIGTVATTSRPRSTSANTGQTNSAGSSTKQPQSSASLRPTAASTYARGTSRRV